MSKRNAIGFSLADGAVITEYRIPGETFCALADFFRTVPDVCVFDALAYYGLRRREKAPHVCASVGEAIYGFLERRARTQADTNVDLTKGVRKRPVPHSQIR